MDSTDLVFGIGGAAGDGVASAGSSLARTLAGIEAEQLLNLAGRNLMLEKTYQFSDYVVNGEHFEAAVLAARDSDSHMYRDTDTGIRHLRKKDGERVLDPERQTRMKSLLTGVIYDGGFEFPVPMFGFSLLDFDFRDRGSQLSVVSLQVSAPLQKVSSSQSSGGLASHCPVPELQVSAPSQKLPLSHSASVVHPTGAPQPAILKWNMQITCVEQGVLMQQPDALCKAPIAPI